MNGSNLPEGNGCHHPGGIFSLKLPNRSSAKFYTLRVSVHIRVGERVGGRWSWRFLFAFFSFFFFLWGSEKKWEKRKNVWRPFPALVPPKHNRIIEIRMNISCLPTFYFSIENDTYIQYSARIILIFFFSFLRLFLFLRFFCALAPCRGGRAIPLRTHTKHTHTDIQTNCIVGDGFVSLSRTPSTSDRSSRFDTCASAAHFFLLHWDVSFSSFFSPIRRFYDCGRFESHQKK